MKFIPDAITTDQAKDAGMAAALLCLIAGFFSDITFFYGFALLLLFLNIVWPRIFKPWAMVWLGIAHILGAVMSRLILLLIFLIFVLPVGLVRRGLGNDTLQLKEWKKINIRFSKYASTNSGRMTLNIRTEAGDKHGFFQRCMGFFESQKKFWLLPIILMLLLCGALMIFAGGSAVGPFIYTLF